ncbi:hypothetical protein ACOJBO_10775 [Rhizobium beringeri]
MRCALPRLAIGSLHCLSFVVESENRLRMEREGGNANRLPVTCRIVDLKWGDVFFKLGVRIGTACAEIRIGDDEHVGHAQLQRDLTLVRFCQLVDLPTLSQCQVGAG